MARMSLSAEMDLLESLSPDEIANAIVPSENETCARHDLERNCDWLNQVGERLEPVALGIWRRMGGDEAAVPVVFASALASGMVALASHLRALIDEILQKHTVSDDVQFRLLAVSAALNDKLN